MYSPVLMIPSAFHSIADGGADGGEDVGGACIGVGEGAGTGAGIDGGGSAEAQAIFRTINSIDRLAIIYINGAFTPFLKYRLFSICIHLLDI